MRTFRPTQNPDHAMSLLSALRRISRTLPISRHLLHRLRRAAGLGFQIVALLRHGLWRRPAPPRPGPICVVGFHGSVLGIGEAARAFSDSLRMAGAEVIDWDISALFGHESQLQGHHLPAPPVDADVMACFLNPREMVQLVAMIGAAPFKGRFCIGCWAWELEDVPSYWAAALRYVDEVWAPSRFVAHAVSTLSETLPIRVMPHPVTPLSAQADRAAFDLPQGVVIVMTAFDIRSGFTRKNPIAAVRAFRAARVLSPGPALMLCKVAGADGAPDLLQALQTEIGDAGDVRLMIDWLTSARMSALVASVDIILSLHRSEGFGLLPAQAMLAKKAVVATGWSGNLEFMNPDDSALVDYRLVPVHDPQGLYDQGRWAEPDTAQAAQKLAALMSDAGARRALGEKAAAHVAHVLDPVRLGRQARAWLGHTMDGG
jgi:glycosyltransferase involved in cell wall biosynthesis